MTSTRQSPEQKQREMIQFQTFRAISGVVPDCAVEQAPAPEPDIVLDYPEGKVGIELTEIHPNGAEKRLQESEQEILAEAAKDLYSQSGLPPVNVSIDWTDFPRLSKSGRRAGAQLLCESVAQNRPEGEQFSQDVGDGNDLIHPKLPVRALSISWASSVKGSDWRDWNFHEVQPPHPGELQERIRQEESKLDVVQKSYVSRWLILVAGAAGPSTWTVLGASLDGATFRSRYDRVFVCLMDRKIVRELPLFPQ